MDGAEARVEVVLVEAEVEGMANKGAPRRPPSRGGGVSSLYLLASLVFESEASWLIQLLKMIGPRSFLQRPEFVPWNAGIVAHRFSSLNLTPCSVRLGL